MVKKIPHKLSIHGHTRIDHYYWMNQREDSAVLDHLKAENERTNQLMSHTRILQDKLFDEIKNRKKHSDQSVPYLAHDYYYYTREIPGHEYKWYCRKKDVPDAEEEILLDVNKLAKGHAFYEIGERSVSPDNQILAFGVDTVSRRNYTIRFKKTETGRFLHEEIPMTTGKAVWANDNQTVFYVQRDEVTLRNCRIRKHRLGTPVTDDEEVYFEADETFSVNIYKTKTSDFLLIASHSTVSTEFRFLDANHPDGKFTLVQTRVRGLEYQVNYRNGYFYIRTNLKARNFRIMRTPVSKPGKAHWEEVIPERPNVLIQSFDLFKDYLVVEERREGLIHLHVVPREGEEYDIDFDEEVYTAGYSTHREYDTDTLRLIYTSMTTPYTTYDFNLKTRERKLLKQQMVTGDFDPARYITKREYATAKDGTRIPISLVYRKGLVKDGNNPALMLGYGSYGDTTDPTFSMSRLSLLDRGFVFAIAHIRGGQFHGRMWYEEGKLLKKKNTFTDFIACTEHLIRQNYTCSSKMFAMGGSAGGLLMGAIANLRPDLYKGIIAAVPFVDVVSTMLDDSIPLTTGEFDEWGDPKDKQYYDYILSYSPYDQVKAQNYPAMLVTTGLHDSQVQYWEPVKWVAKLRAMKTDCNPLLLKIFMDFGHFGASGRFEYIKETALEYAFMFDLLGIRE